MFGHFNAEEFVNLIEGIDIPSKRRVHLDHCSRCNATWKSMKSAHADLTSHAHLTNNDADVVEPDWSEFRSSVRNALLSRSVKRASRVRRWTGWPVRPAMAWASSVIMVVGITAGAFLWHQEADRRATPPAIVEEPADSNASIDAEMTVWSQTSVFEELSQLRSVEVDNLRSMLVAAEQGELEQ